MPAHRAVTVEVSRYLSSPRMAPHLTAASGDRDLALALYQWNLQLAAALQEVLGVVEVVVRNAIDEQLRAWNPTRGRDYITGRAELLSAWRRRRQRLRVVDHPGQAGVFA
ncbi:hypothetical protein LTT66_02720 [Nocardia gipuzkoensis]|uniref:hypothetical protein n=1 Tax=Nocardia gipuzkoensis TaxID=2749991 RepID=UPI001E31B5EB|nr:hypothetical protein [Nocardia gipuzkoensis]UGT69143.1 hypothetical protein LTT66_02720 [Nocardia gipuzkoensis]